MWRAGRNEDTPLMANGVLYTVTGLGLIAALDPATGQTRWVYDPQIYKDGRPIPIGFLHHGLAYWTDGTAERLLFAAGNGDLISVDARTGRPDMAFGKGGRVDTALRIRGAIRMTNFAAKRPVIAGDVVVVGSAVGGGRNKEAPPGDVQAFSVRTGKLLWTFHTVPRSGEFGYETWLNGSAEYSGKATVWVGMAYDPELDYVYLPTATGPTTITAAIGQETISSPRVWSASKPRPASESGISQAIHHGLWDYDLASVPVLGDITVNGRRIKAVMRATCPGNGIRQRNPFPQSHRRSISKGAPKII